MAEFVAVGKKRQRLTFGRAHDLLEIPDMIEIQKYSYESFYQEEIDPDLRIEQGLEELLQEVFPIESYDGSFALEYVRYYIDEPKVNIYEARQRDLTWSKPVRATIRLVNRKTKEIKEEEIYLGDFPAMTDRGTFIINGTERVVVNQLARSAGVYFSAETEIPGQESFAAKIIPDRGAWLEFSLTPGDVLSVNIDNRKKLPATILLKAFGVENNDHILELFNAEKKEIDLSEEEIRGKLIANSILDEEGNVLIPRNERLTKEYLEILWDRGRTKVEVWEVDPSIAATLERDNTNNSDEAVLELFRRLRPNEPARIENAREYVYGLFFDTRRYNLGRVGRYKLNRKLDLEIPETNRLITVEDLMAIIGKLLKLKAGEGNPDDIDHLGNRRVRSVGELLQNQIRIGLLRMERIAKERMTTVPDLEKAMARDLINVRPIAASIREFFGSGQLSQFMDQTNPLSEITHRRRLSAIGPGGLSRERAGFEVRDVHATHYGRMCPIETPEGPNIGLINSLATFARVNKYGFIETPYRKVEDAQVTDEVHYMSATEEMRHVVAQANAQLDDKGKFINDLVSTRQSGEYTLAPSTDVSLIDVSPKQLVSVAASLIPFLENDDANRALMGSNMQRQAVPLLQAEAPLVGTGIEEKVAIDSGAAIQARRAGVIDQVDAQRIVVRATEDLEPGDPGVDIYRLRKFQRSNQNTCINQRPLVKVGDD